MRWRIIPWNDYDICKIARLTFRNSLKNVNLFETTMTCFIYDIVNMFKMTSWHALAITRQYCTSKMIQSYLFMYRFMLEWKCVEKYSSMIAGGSSMSLVLYLVKSEILFLSSRNKQSKSCTSLWVRRSLLVVVIEDG